MASKTTAKKTATLSGPASDGKDHLGPVGITPADDSTMPGLNGDGAGKPKTPTKKATAKKAAAKPAPAPKANFVGGAQKKLGTINHEAAKKNSGDPERLQPKVSMGDGVTAKPKMKIWLKRGDAPATVVETYQAAALVETEDGSQRTVAYSQMSRRK